MNITFVTGANCDNLTDRYSTNGGALMEQRPGEVWLFVVDSPKSETVYLVGSLDTGPSTKQAMTRSESGQWELRRHLDPGRYRFRYYTAERGIFINCGTERLRCTRLEGDDPNVHVSPSTPTTPTTPTTPANPQHTPAA